MSPNKIAVVGLGYVGITTSLFFADTGSTVVCIDKNKEKINMLKNKKKCLFMKKIVSHF